MGLKCTIPGMLLLLVACGDAWSTADQRGQRLYNAGDFAAAAETYNDPLWKGMALCGAKEFKQAAEAFELVPTSTGFYNLGYCRSLLGEYDAAIEAFEDALALDPDNADARFNRDLVIRIQAKLNADVDRPDSEGDTHYTPDEIRFDEKGEKGQEGRVDETTMSPAKVGDLWLRQIRTTPADFLRRKFEVQAKKQ